MATTTSVYLSTADGVLQAIITDFVSESGTALEYVLNVGQIGALIMTVQAGKYDQLLNPGNVDWRLEVWIAIDGRPPIRDGDAVYLIRRWEYTDHTTTVTAYHATDLLRRRIIAYASGTSYTTKSAAAAGNQIKAFADENLGTSISGANRDGAETQADLETSGYLTIQANLSDGASIAKAATRRNLFEVVRELCDASTTAGTYLTAEVIANGTQLELRTYVGQRGVDRRVGTANPVVLSAGRRNLENMRLTVDRASEVTVAIAGGAGLGTSRLIGVAIDSARIAESIYNRCEAFTDSANTGTQAALDDDADAALRAGRPITTFSADLVDTAATTRGIHYNLGDIVTAEFRGQQYDCRVDVITVSIRPGDGRRQRAELRSVT